MTFAFNLDERFQQCSSQDERRAALRRQGRRRSATERDRSARPRRDLRRRRLPRRGRARRISSASASTRSTRNRYIHNKFMLVDPLSDDPLVVTGSANFSRPSQRTNDENMLVDPRRHARGRHLLRRVHAHLRSPLRALHRAQAPATRAGDPNAGYLKVTRATGSRPISTRRAQGQAAKVFRGVGPADTGPERSRSGAEALRQLAELLHDDVVRGVRHGVRRTRGAPLGWPLHEGAPVPRLPGRHQVEIVAGDHEDLVRPIPEPLAQVRYASGRVL